MPPPARLRWHGFLSHCSRMKTLLNLTVQIILVCALLMAIRCSSRDDSSKAIAEDKNAAKFDTKNGEQDAQFLVDAVDDSYTIIRLAELAVRKGNKETADKAREVLRGQKEILDDLKTYASEQVISVPASGPENLRDTHEVLYKEDARFDTKWCREMLNENEQLLKAFEKYNERTEVGNLKELIAGSLPTLRSHQDKLLE